MRHHRLDLQLEHLQLGHRVAVAALGQGGELTGIEQGADHPLLIVEVGAQALALPLHRQFQRLAGTEGQGHRTAAEGA